MRIAIDDFGTGYSSLSTLKPFPIDTLKIDRTFIADLASDPEDRRLTEAILRIARTLELHVVAEGVENRGQHAFLRERHASRCPTAVSPPSDSGPPVPCVRWG